MKIFKLPDYEDYDTSNKFFIEAYEMYKFRQKLDRYYNILEAAIYGNVGEYFPEIGENCATKITSDKYKEHIKKYYSVDETLDFTPYNIAECDEMYIRVTPYFTNDRVSFDVECYKDGRELKGTKILDHLDNARFEVRKYASEFYKCYEKKAKKNNWKHMCPNI